VEQCPVDIEHVDHIVDMRRYQVLIESSFPAEAGVMLRNLENKGNPWGAPPNAREDWTKGLDFEVPRVGEVDDFEYLFWVGCAGAFEDRAKKTTRAVATLLHEAGVRFAILGEGETCTGDPARRIGNEFLFQTLAQQNVETLNEAFEGREKGKRKIVATCPTSTASSAATSRSYTTPSSWPTWSPRAGSPPCSRWTASSRTTTRATSAGTTGSSPRRGNSSTPPSAAEPRTTGARPVRA
jgi:Fe-S oxidoreductase